MSEKIKIKLNTDNDKIKIKVRDEEGNLVCHINYLSNMNSLGIFNAENEFIKWVPLG
tara:strand:- start:190 stop:360 length:171 start_codon:yes stop_codon:yes gene_type:complete